MSKKNKNKNKSVTQQLKEQGFVITEAPNFTKEEEVNTIVGVNGEVMTEEMIRQELEDVTNLLSGEEKEVFLKVKDALFALIITMGQTEKKEEFTNEEERVELFTKMLSKNLRKECPEMSKSEIKEFVTGFMAGMKKVEAGETVEPETVPASAITPSTTQSFNADKRAAIEAVMRQMQPEETVEPETVPTSAITPSTTPTTTPITKVTAAKIIAREPKMTEYRKAGKIRDFYNDLALWQQQHA